MTALDHESQLSGYKAKLVAGKCTERGCERRPADGSSMCTPCHTAYKERNKESQQRKRDARRAAGLCIWCPGDDPNPATPPEHGALSKPTSCLPCRIKRNRMRAADGGVTGVVTEGRDAAIAAATSRDIAGRNGRVRYRGQQKRGQQPKWQLNVQDLRHVKEDFGTFERMINNFATPEFHKMHGSERAEDEIAVAHVGDRMIRRTGDILERLGHRRDYPDGTPTGLPDPDDVDPDTDTLTYKRPSDAQRVAAAAQPGQFVYAPPLDVVSGRRETGKQSAAPDLAGLRAQLAGRGLGLVDEGAFYWRVTKNGDSK